MEIARSDIVKSIAGRDKGKYFFVLEWILNSWQNAYLLYKKL